MASSKISALGSGTTAQATDLFVVARGSNNNKLTSAQVFSETLTRSAFETKRAANGLIAGRRYRITGCGSGNNLAVVVTATQDNERDNRVVWDSTAGPVEADWLDLQQNPAAVFDGAGNSFHNYFAFGGTKPTLNNPANFFNCRVACHDGLTLYNVDSCSLQEVTLRDGSYDLDNYQIWNSTFIGSSVGASTGNVKNIYNSHLVNSTLDTSVGDNVSLVNVQLSNSSLLLAGSSNLELQNCFFQNVNLTITNGASVNGLTILGTSAETLPTYTIDGALQASVLNFWAGVVIADALDGSSTVKANVTTDTSNGELTFNPTSKTLYLPDRSPIGVYLLANSAGGTQEINVVSTAGNVDNRWHVKKLANKEGQIKVTPTSDSTLSAVDRVVKYHNASTKLGELNNNADFVVLSAYYSNTLNDYAWAIVDGHHYD